MICEKFIEIGEFAAAGVFEKPEAGLFLRKSLGIRRYYENCKLYKYEGKPLYPSGILKEDMIITPHYLQGFSVDYGRRTAENEELIKIFQNDILKNTTKVPSEHSVAGAMYCHSIPNYGRIIREGFNSYADRIKNIADIELREGLLNVYEGIKCYVGRCVEYLEKACADRKIIEALKKVPLEKADNIYEAVVSWNFVMYLDNCDNLGCLAKELYEFYNGEDIVPLLENLYDNLDMNNGYSMALGTEYNELTIQCLKALVGKRRPMAELFVDENTPEKIWETAFEVMRSQGGQPAFYNPILLEKIRETLAVSDEDIKSFCGGGCTESMIAGMSNVGSIDAGINLLLIFEKTMYNYLSEAKSFEDFYEKYIDEVRTVAEDVMEKISLSQKERAIFNPLPMRTLLIDDCIDRGTEYNGGGARYKWSIINFAGLINVTDALLAIKELIFDKKSENVEDFLQKLKNNDEEFLKKCRKVQLCFGIDDEVSNKFAYQLSHTVFSMLDTKTPYLGGKFLPASIQFMSQADAGRNIGATPDGRKAGAPLCDSLAAIFGKDFKGSTALLKSVTALDLKKVTGVPVLNFNVDESWSNDILKAVILSYAEMGGIQMQISYVSEKTLREAYENPDLHRNLVVRVGGYSEYFCNLSDELKKMIVERRIQKIGR